jgi:hypothetical protein
MTRRFFPLYAHQWRLPALAFGDPDRREAA